MKRLVVFDFDGVIVDSNQVKREAFLDIFRNHELFPQILKYYKINHSLNRFVLFQYILDSILKSKKVELIELWAEEYKRSTIEKVINAQYMPGYWELNQFLKQNEVGSIILTATPQTDIDIIVEKRNISKNYLEVLGAPKKKSEWLKYIKSKYHLNGEQLYFIGDAKTDYLSSMDADVNFIGLDVEGDLDCPLKFKDHGNILKYLSEKY